MLAGTHAALVFALMAFATGCATGTSSSDETPISVASDFDSETNFQSFRTYDWLPTTPAESNPTLDKWVKSAVASQLENKGLQRKSIDPDLLLTYHVGVEDKIAVSDRGYQYIPRQRRRTGSRPGDMPTTVYREGTLILDCINAATKELVFRASAQAVLDEIITSEEDERFVTEAVRRMLERYPSQAGS
jgi:hypothetical protein